MAINLNINISNKAVYSMLAILLVAIVGVGVVAYDDTPSTPGNPAAFGHTMDEISYISADGATPVSLEAYINGLVSGVGQITCPSSAIYDSTILTESWPGGNGQTGVAYNDRDYKYTAVDIRASYPTCMSDAGCIIKQEIYDSSSLTIPKLVRQYNYVQYPSASAGEKWVSSYRTSGTYTNGDTTKIDIVPAYSSSNLQILDDYVKSGTGNTNEQSKDSWVFKDLSGSYGMKVYICSDSTAEAL